MKGNESDGMRGGSGKMLKGGKEAAIQEEEEQQEVEINRASYLAKCPSRTMKRFLTDEKNYPPLTVDLDSLSLLQGGSCQLSKATF